jgi:CxxC-x17-CxxC domain-containing protein
MGNMKSKSKPKPAAVPRIDPYLDGLMAKLLERFVNLEKKMDTVIAQTSGKPIPETKQPPHRERVLYEAVCADCHKVCEVPFRPSEDRAVYCKACFARRKSGPQNIGAPLPAGRQGQARAAGQAYPILTPVSMPSNIMNKPHMAAHAAPLLSGTPQKRKKRHLAKKAKKKK